MTEPGADKPEEKVDGPFAKLCEPVTIGSVKLSGRLVLPAMATGFGSAEGFLTERCIAYYLERARGRPGLIIVEPTAVSREGRHTGNTLVLDDSLYLPMHVRLCDTLHAEEVKVFLQLMHAGRKTSSRLTGLAPVAPSAEPDSDFGETPLELASAQVTEIVNSYVASAVMVRTAGYDGVEILASGGFLLHQFLSADSNHRADRYGGDLISRSSVLCEIISGIRRVEPDFVISVRIGPGREGQYHLPMDELRQVAKLAVTAGASCINVAHGAEMLPRTERVPIASPGRVMQPVEPLLKDTVDVPVIGGGNVFDMPTCEKLVRDGRMDLVALGRPIVADPRLPLVVAEGDIANLRPCIYCNVCLGRSLSLTMMCPANPMVGREQSFWQAKRGVGHRVIVVGAGLAGLWTAFMAAELGYTVEIHESGNILGNLLAVRSRVPGQTENYRIVDYLSRELRLHNVPVKLRSRITARDIIEKQPDAAFITKIGNIQEPDIAGLSNVHTVDPVAVLSGDPSMGDKVVLLGGGLMAAEIAYYLAKHGKRVTMLEERSRVASDTHPELRQHIIAALREMDCPVYVGVHGMQVNIYGELTAQHEGRTLKLLVDTVVLASNYERCDKSYSELEMKMREFHMIGDAYETGELTRLIYKATRILVDMADRL